MKKYLMMGLLISIVSFAKINAAEVDLGDFLFENHHDNALAWMPIQVAIPENQDWQNQPVDNLDDLLEQENIEINNADRYPDYCWLEGRLRHTIDDSLEDLRIVSRTANNERGNTEERAIRFWEVSHNQIINTEQVLPKLLVWQMVDEYESKLAYDHYQKYGHSR